MELTIKDIIGPNIYGHDLEELADKLKLHLNSRGVELPDWVTVRLQEFSAIDRRSTAFRYGTSPGGEIYVNLNHLKQAMAVLYIALSSVAWSGTFPPESLWQIIDEDDLDCPVLLSHRLQNRP